MKIKIGDVEYEFKFITIPEDHKFDEDSLKLLQKLDEGLEKSKEGILGKDELKVFKEDIEKQIKEIKSDFNYDKMQSQLVDIYSKMEDIGLKPATSKEELEAKEYTLNNKWMRAFLKNKVSEMTEIRRELKESIEPILHIGTGTDEIDADMSQGGYLVPTLMTTEIYRFVEQGGIARREMRYLPFVGPGNSRYLHRLLTSVTVSWIDEGETKPKTKPTTERIQQTLKKLAAMVILTEEIVEDAAVDLVSFCSQLLGEAIAAEEDNQFFAGTGAPWTGLINDTAITSYALAAGVGPLDMRPESLLTLTVAIPLDAVGGAKFYMHRQVWTAICARRADAVSAGDTKGGYLIQQPSQGSPGSIWGFPVVLVEAMPSMTDLGYGEGDTECDPEEPFIIFGNLNKCCIYGDKKGLRIKVLDQASVYDENDNLINLAERDMIALRVHKRVGYITILPSGLVILTTGAAS